MARKAGGVGRGKKRKEGSEGTKRYIIINYSLLFNQWSWLLFPSLLMFYYETQVHLLTFTKMSLALQWVRPYPQYNHIIMLTSLKEIYCGFSFISKLNIGYWHFKTKTTKSFSEDI